MLNGPNAQTLCHRFCGRPFRIRASCFVAHQVTGSNYTVGPFPQCCALSIMPSRSYPDYHGSKSLDAIVREEGGRSDIK
jgi:hypothetical protein